MATDTDTADHDDRLTVPHFTTALWAELADLHEQRQTDSDQPAPVDDIADLRQRHGRRTRRSLYVGAGAIAAAAALVVVVSAQSIVTDDAPEAEEPELIRLMDEAAAMAEDEMVVHAVTDVIRVAPDTPEMNRYDEEQWADFAAPGDNIHVTLRDQQGNLVEELAGTFRPQPNAAEPTTRAIDHVARTYTEGCWGMSGTYGAPSDWIDVMRNMLAEGRYFEDGTEVVDGQELLVVRIGTYRDEVGELVPADTSALYVDPETYLPVLNRFYDQDRNVETEVRFEYLPRTPENLAHTEVPAPPQGYTEVPVDDDRC